MNTGQNVSEGIVVEAAAEAALAVADRVAENPDLVRVDFVLHAEPEHRPAVADATAVAAGLAEMAAKGRAVDRRAIHPARMDDVSLHRGVCDPARMGEFAVDRGA